MQQNVCDSDIWIGTKEFCQNAGNRISEVLDFKIPPTPLEMRGLMYASVSSGAVSTSGIKGPRVTIHHRKEGDGGSQYTYDFL
jgi:hypothetical protein